MASSCALRQSRWRVGWAGLSAGVEEREGGAMEESSAGVGARRTIFLEWSVLRAREGVVKGGLRTPSLGVMMNFWVVGGMERSVWMRVERSVMVEEGGKSNVWGVPWWVNVMLIDASSFAEGGEGGKDAAGWLSSSAIAETAVGALETRVGNR